MLYVIWANHVPCHVTPILTSGCYSCSYCVDWYAGVVLLQKQDISAARIGKLVDITELHDKLKADYIQRATAISQWVDHKIQQHGDRTIDDTMAGIKSRLADFYQYKKVSVRWVGVILLKPWFLCMMC